MRLWQGKNLRVAVVGVERFRRTSFFERQAIANWHRTWRVGPVALVVYWPRRWERWMNARYIPILGRGPEV